jgi:ribitol-5-phosphate 2-dehydrogenase (NADP+) / D-ribitol-5-phosphate cytidylyltransferase
MYQGYRIGAVLLMGGSGVRFGAPIPKQFSLLGDRPLYRYALETFLASGVFDEIVLVCHPDWLQKVEARSPIVEVASGGPTRQESSRSGLLAFSSLPEVVLIHDAVRPFVTETMILANLDAAIAWGAADTCIPTADTLVHAPEKSWIHAIPKREEFLRGQTPQTFRYDLIVQAHARAKEKGLSNLTDDCSLILAMGEKVAVVRGSEENLKITSQFDLTMAEALLSVRNEKVEK